jgi:hypothetical protein
MIGACTISNIVKVVAIVFMVACFMLTDKNADDIIKIAVAMVGVFMPIDINKTLKNIKEGKNVQESVHSGE